MTRRWWPLLAGYLVAAVVLAGYGAVSGARRFAQARVTDPGPLTEIAGPVGYFTATLAGAVTLGALLYVVITARPDDAHVIDPPSFRAHRLAEVTAAVWLVAALLMIPVQAGMTTGASGFALLAQGRLPDALAVSEMARAWIVVAVCAAAIAATLRLTVRWVPHAVLLIPASIAVVAPPVTGNAGQGPDHDYAGSAAIVFATMLAITAGLRVTAAICRPGPELSRRISVVLTCGGAIALAYGAMLALLLLDGPADLLRTDYGRWLALAAVLLTAVTAADALAWRRGALTGGYLTGTSWAITAAVAAVSAMAIQAAPRLLNHDYTIWDVFLGYELPDPPNLWRLVTDWRFDSFFGAVALVAAALYIAGYLRLRRRGDDWSTGRLLSWLIGCLALLIGTSSGMRTYGSAMFSVHMAEHMLINMFVPILLVLGGPVTLALRALRPADHDATPGPREWVLALVHSKFTGFFAHPATAFLMFVSTLYIVYFTPLFDTLVRYHWGHELMTTHFLMSGYLFFWVIIGIDPGPRRLPFLGRLAVLFAVMPFHAFFGIALMTMTSIIGGDFYRMLDLPWMHSLIDDQHLGGSITWGSSELPILIVVIALVVQWARSDRRAARRADRHADAGYSGDDDLDAYNAMLAELAKHRN
ncbi:cytochrome c oxidase assembly protein [Mycolicibacterium brumae]|nr:cytochrome c oxidase assembly protein [Mycolicibacterium brumae]MCV7194210.1 cytochrome c oxidase assembly protein [Mycolicibacterium brumae]RWA19431.1 hypothetical protein MBRU_16900 [Mycolicibacterium brumae DSM 44177]UWW08377.1 cytochrome c oxidase assembly protein [Mycolicibacterium brumae]